MNPFNFTIFKDFQFLCWQWCTFYDSLCLLFQEKLKTPKPQNNESLRHIGASGKATGNPDSSGDLWSVLSVASVNWTLVPKNGCTNANWVALSDIISWGTRLSNAKRSPIIKFRKFWKKNFWRSGKIQNKCCLSIDF